jgi:hypothetical protein
MTSLSFLPIQAMQPGCVAMFPIPVIVSTLFSSQPSHTDALMQPPRTQMNQLTPPCTGYLLFWRVLIACFTTHSLSSFVLTEGSCNLIELLPLFQLGHGLHGPGVLLTQYMPHLHSSTSTRALLALTTTCTSITCGRGQGNKAAPSSGGARGSLRPHPYSHSEFPCKRNVRLEALLPNACDQTLFPKRDPTRLSPPRPPCGRECEASLQLAPHIAGLHAMPCSCAPHVSHPW